MKSWIFVGTLLSGAALLIAPACSKNDGATLGDGDGDGDGDMGGMVGDGDGDGDGDAGGGTLGDGDAAGGMGGLGGMNQGGQGGGGAIAPTAECTEYCTQWLEKECDLVMQVTEPYDDEADCLSTCDGFSHAGTDGTAKGDSVQCRIEQLNLAMVQGSRCANAQETPAAQCTGDPE